MKMTTQSPKSVHRPLARTLLFVSFMAVCLALFQTAQAVNPPPDGGYSGDNTAEEPTQPSVIERSTTRPALPTRPSVRLRSITTPPAKATRPTVIERSTATPAAARTRPSANQPGLIRQLVLAMCILETACSALLARATPATSKASSPKRLPVESQFSLMQAKSSARPLPQNASRRTSNRWTKPAKRFSL